MPPPMIVMGRVVAAFGVRGSVKIAPLSAEPATLAAFPSWFLRAPATKAWHEHKVDGVRLQGSVLVAEISGVASREAAQALRGFEVAVRREDLPPAAAGEIYAADLAGFRVTNREGVELGQVEAVKESGAHPLLEVAHAGGTRLIPYVPAVVIAVDPKAATIEVDWGADY